MRHISYFSYYESPIGIIKINTNEYDVLSVSFVKKMGVENENSLSIRVKDEIDRYFKGELKAFSFYNYMISGLQKKVLKIVSRIPYGEVMTYKEIAKKLGNENVVKPIINALYENPCPILIPCHRVVGNDEELYGYIGGVKRKKFLLELEEKYKDIDN